MYTKCRRHNFANANIAQQPWNGGKGSGDDDSNVCIVVVLKTWCHSRLLYIYLCAVCYNEAYMIKIEIYMMVVCAQVRMLCIWCSPVCSTRVSGDKKQIKIVNLLFLSSSSLAAAAVSHREENRCCKSVARACQQRHNVVATARFHVYTCASYGFVCMCVVRGSVVGGCECFIVYIHIAWLAHVVMISIPSELLSYTVWHSGGFRNLFQQICFQFNRAAHYNFYMYKFSCCLLFTTINITF